MQVAVPSHRPDDEHVHDQNQKGERKRADRDVYVVLDCECEWEPEHGLQLSLHRGTKLVRVSEQDGEVREEDA